MNALIARGEVGGGVSRLLIAKSTTLFQLINTSCDCCFLQYWIFQMYRAQMAKSSLSCHSIHHTTSPQNTPHDGQMPPSTLSGCWRSDCLAVPTPRPALGWCCWPRQPRDTTRKHSCSLVLDTESSPGSTFGEAMGQGWGLGGGARDGVNIEEQKSRVQHAHRTWNRWEAFVLIQSAIKTHKILGWYSSVVLRALVFEPPTKDQDSYFF